MMELVVCATDGYLMKDALELFLWLWFLLTFEVVVALKLIY